MRTAAHCSRASELVLSHAPFRAHHAGPDATQGKKGLGQAAPGKVVLPALPAVFRQCQHAPRASRRTLQGQTDPPARPGDVVDACVWPTPLAHNARVCVCMCVCMYVWSLPEGHDHNPGWVEVARSGRSSWGLVLGGLAHLFGRARSQYPRALEPKSLEAAAAPQELARRGRSRSRQPQFSGTAPGRSRRPPQASLRSAP